MTVKVEAVQSEYDQWLERVQATFESVAFCCWHRLGDRAAAAEVSTQVVARLVGKPSIFKRERTSRVMQLSDKIKTAGATGYILLWLLGIPLPILLLIFLLRGCT